MEWIDTHCHIDHKQFHPDREAVMENARRGGLAAMIVPAISWESNFTVRQDPALERCWLRYAVGVHPNHVAPGMDLGALEGLIDRRTVAIGETGLDFFRTRDAQTRQLQREMFRKQIELAVKHDLPLILHVRDAWDSALEILKSYDRTFSGVAHCFTGAWIQARGFMELGFALGIGGAVTRGNDVLAETVKKAPLEMLLLETDAPFLAPKGCKGRNTPENIPIIAEVVAGIRGTDTDAVMNATSGNARRIFRL